METELTPWQELTKLTQNEAFEVERVRLKRTGIAVEGRFELPAIVMMPEDDQVFMSAFLRCHGSIKEMERLFGISYPTVKARLNRIAEQLPFVETVENSAPSETSPSSDSSKDILERLSEGEINPAEAVKLLKKRKGAL